MSLLDASGQAFLDALNDAVFFHDPESGQVLHANARAEQTYGYDVEALRALSMDVLSAGVPPHSATEARKRVRAAARGEPQGFEWLARHRDGHTFWVEVSLSLAHLGAQDVVVAAVRDIAARKQQQHALKESEERVRTILDSTHDIIWSLDTEGNFTFVNRRGEELTGHRAAEWTGLSFAPLLHPSDLPAAAEALQRTLSGQRWRFDTRVFDRHGQVHELQVNTAPLVSQGAVTGLVGFGTDVTERRRTEAALADEKERLAVTLRSIADGVITTGPDGRVGMINEVAELVTGWRQEEARGRPLEDVYQPADPEDRRVLSQALSRMLQGEAVAARRDQQELRTKDGRPCLVSQSLAAIRDRHGRSVGAVLVFRDITERVHTEEELRRAQKLESVAVLAGGLAHDFRNLLTAILGNIALAREAGALEQRAHLLAEAERACLHARDLTQRLLTFSSGGAPLLRPGSVALLLQDAAPLAVRGYNVRCHVDLPEELWSVAMDAGQMAQVFTNLLLNACQSMERGGDVTLGARNVSVPEPVLRHGVHLPAGRFVEVEVADHGVGIPREHLAKIFDPFFTTKAGGTGLGLAVSYSIVQGHGGHIAVESTRDVGTHFYVLLPASAEADAEPAPPLAPAAPGRGRILLMDDEDMILTIAAQILQIGGYAVVTAHDGLEAVRRFGEARDAGDPFDAVIMDLTVHGGMGGTEAVKLLREMHPQAVVLVSSGYSNDPVMAHYRGHGFDGVVAKPYTPRELLDAVGRTLAGRRRPTLAPPAPVAAR